MDKIANRISIKDHIRFIFNKLAIPEDSKPILEEQGQFSKISLFELPEYPDHHFLLAMYDEKLLSNQSTTEMLELEIRLLEKITTPIISVAFLLNAIPPHNAISKGFHIVNRPRLSQVVFIPDSSLVSTVSSFVNNVLSSEAIRVYGIHNINEGIDWLEEQLLEK